MAQPSFLSDDGYVLTLGFITQGQKWDVVFPMAADDHTLPVGTETKDLCLSFIDDCLPDVLSFTAEDTHLVFIQAEGMVHGKVPFRNDFAAATHVGDRTGESLPPSNALCCDYYVDPAQVLASGRIRVGKNSHAGISKEDIVNDIFIPAITALAETFANKLLLGFDNQPNTGKWYRVGAAVRETAQALPNIVATVVRDYVVTQRRRLTPRS